jgi:hypothetical protein
MMKYLKCPWTVFKICSVPVNILPLLEVLVLSVWVGEVVVVILMALPAAQVASGESNY